MVYTDHLCQGMFSNRFLIDRNSDQAKQFGENFSKLYNLIEKNSQNDRTYYRIENFQDPDFDNFIERKYWKQLIQHLVRYKQVREKAVEELETSPLFQFAIRLSQEGSRRLYCTTLLCSMSKCV